MTYPGDRDDARVRSGLRRLLAPLGVAAAAAMFVGCAGTGGGGGPAPQSLLPVDDLWPGAAETLLSERPGCDVLADPAAPGGTFVVAVTDTVLPQRAPIPHNAAERLVFGHLYETLVRVDCSGLVRPGLASNWTCTGDSTVWVFTLRDEARFWDGTRITAEDVRRSWRSNQVCPRTSDQTSPWNWFNSRSQSVTVLDARRLAVRLPEPQALFPLLLAHPAMAVAVRRDGWIWPVGSGPCRLRASDPAPLPDLTSRPNPHHPDQPAWSEMVFRILPGGDPRDQAGGDMDLLVTRELAMVRFFEAVPGFQATPLPWDRLYLMACPPEANPGGNERWRSAATRLDPERDLTLVSARGWPSVVFPAGDSRSCPQLSGPVAAGNRARLDWELADKPLDHDTLVYPADDPGAREMAHRLVALGGSDLRAVGLSPEAMAFALEWQMAGAFVLPEPQRFPTACLQLAALLGRAAWLQEIALALPPPRPVETLGQARHSRDRARDPAAELVRGGSVSPLALTRAWLIARGDLGGVTLEFDGMPRLSGLGRNSSSVTP